jgi:hypothetical protein
MKKKGTRRKYGAMAKVLKCAFQILGVVVIDVSWPGKSVKGNSTLQKTIHLFFSKQTFSSLQ